MPRRSRTTLIDQGKCRATTGRPDGDLPAAEQQAHLDQPRPLPAEPRARRRVLVVRGW